MTKSLTEGKPLKLVLQFSAPILLSMLFQQFYLFFFMEKMVKLIIFLMKNLMFNLKI